MNELPPLPEPVRIDPKPYGHRSFVTMAYTADQMREYAAAAVAAERERCAQIADEAARRNFPWGSENSDKYHAQADWAEIIAAKIRATAQEVPR